MPADEQRIGEEWTSPEELKKWRDFGARRAEAPALRFTAGFRHSVRKKDYCRRHSHEAMEIVFHHAGAGVTRVGDGAVVPFAATAVIIYGPGVPHDQTMDCAGEDVCVQLEIPRREHGRIGEVFRVASLTDPILIEELLSLSESPMPGDATAQAVLHHRATAVLLGLLGTKQVGERATAVSSAALLARGAETYLRRHYQKITSLREVAEHLGVGPDHLRHVFRQERRLTLIDFLTGLRLDRARFLLRSTGLPLKQVADLAGFSNEYYFSTAFRRRVGMAPSEFRRMG